MNQNRLNNVVFLNKLLSKTHGYEQESIDVVLYDILKNFFEFNYGRTVTECIKKGDQIVIKPNFVLEENMLVGRDHLIVENANDSFITNVCIIKSLLRVLSSVKGIKVKIIEAPVQFCKIEKIITPEIMCEFESILGGEIEFIDLRNTKLFLDEQGDIIGREINLRPEDSYIDFNLGDKSTFKSKEKYVKRFRVTDYPPCEMKKYHSKGKHIYRVSKEIIQADWIFNIPKLKTHMKAGITGAMKNFIGVVVNKECLPHHIKGSPFSGGDCHGDVSLWKWGAENCLDLANTFLNNEFLYRFFRKCANGFIKLGLVFRGDKEITGSWYGNDTIWRTVYDVNSIIYYGQLNGNLSNEVQRNVITITDAIVTGEKNGPMRPIPVYTNAITVGSSTMAVDIVNAALMKFDGELITHMNQIRNADCKKIISDEDIEIYSNGEKLTLEDVKSKYGLYHEAADGWHELLNK